MEITPEDKKKAYMKAYYEKNRIRLLEQMKNYHTLHSNDIKDRKKRNYHNNPEYARQYSRNYSNSHKEDMKIWRKEYQKRKSIEIKNKRKVNYQKNSDIIKKRNATYAKNRASRDPLFRMMNSLRVRIRNAYKAQGGTKNNKTLNILGCGKEQLKTYLESRFKSGMSHENYGYKGWHIDHIIPISSAKNDLEKIKELCHYTNLQPLWWWENLEKSNKLDIVTENDK